MRFSAIATVSGLAAVVAADNHAQYADYGHYEPQGSYAEYGHYDQPQQEHWVPDQPQQGGNPEQQVCAKETVTVYGSMGAAPAPTPATTDLWTKEDKVTSVKYEKEQTSMYLPSAGLYENPYHKGETISADQPKYTNVDKWWSTVYAYPTAGGNECDGVMAVYQDLHVVEVKVVVINVEKHEVISTKADAPAYTPAQPPAPPASLLPPLQTENAPPTGKTHTVELRAEGGLRYIPDRVDAEVGDIIQFKFFSAAHSVSQSTFDQPCALQRNAQGMPVFDTDLVPNQQNEAGPQFERTYHVTTKEPQWFYCKQQNNNHCGNGMVFGVNPAGKMDQFIDNAKKSGGVQANPPPPNAPQQPPPGENKPQYPGVPEDARIVKVEGGIMPDGSGSTLKFDPPFINGLKKGDTIYFDFLARNHTLTQSTLKTPCLKKTDGADIVDTNFDNANPEGTPGLKVVPLTITTEDTQYFYCKQANGAANGHCKAGMLFAINIEEPLFQEFLTNARNTPLAGAKFRRM